MDAVVRVTATCGNKPPAIVLELDRRLVLPGGAVEADASKTLDSDNGPQSLRFHWEFPAAPDAPFSRIDVTDCFTVDTVREPGEQNGSGGIEVTGYVFLVDGFDGSHVGVPTAQGLPASGRIGPFELGPYDGLNAVKLAQTSTDVTIPVDPPIPGDRLTYPVTGGLGDSDLSVRITYEDDSVQETVMYCDDWFDDDPPQGEGGALRTGFLVPVIDGLDRMDGAGTSKIGMTRRSSRGRLSFRRLRSGSRR